MSQEKNRRPSEPAFKIASARFVFITKFAAGFVAGAIVGFLFIFRRGDWLDPTAWNVTTIAILLAVGVVFGVLAATVFKNK